MYHNKFTNKSKKKTHQFEDKLQTKLDFACLLPSEIGIFCCHSVTIEKDLVTSAVLSFLGDRLHDQKGAYVQDRRGSGSSMRLHFMMCVMSQWKSA